MSFLERLNNVYVIDTKMWGFDHYSSSFLVKGKELALIDTGEPSQLEAVRASIRGHGFAISEISYIFVTHCEHLDHAGNVAPLLRESPRASVYINQKGLDYLTDPDSIPWEEKFSPELLEKRKVRGVIEPVPPSRIKYLNDGDVFDLGNDERLRIIYTPGHQPSGIVIYEEKHRGLFINDLIGNCFADANVHYTLNPFDSDNIQAIESLKKLMDLPAAYLYLGHYGISDKPKQVMSRAIDNMQRLLDIGTKYVREGRPERIADKVYEMILPELEKLRKVRGEALYKYATQEHVPFQAKLFAKYCQERFK